MTNKTYTNAELEHLGDMVTSYGAQFSKAEADEELASCRLKQARRTLEARQRELNPARRKLAAAKLALKKAIESSTSA